MKIKITIEPVHKDRKTDKKKKIINAHNTAGKKCGKCNKKSVKHDVSVPKKISEIAEDLRYDIDAIIERDPASRSRAEAALLYSGFHALVAHRIAHSLNEHGAHFTARMISQGARFLTGIEIHPGATIGRGLFIDHGAGVVIGETAIIGDNCTIYHGCKLSAVTGKT